MQSIMCRVAAGREGTPCSSSHDEAEPNEARVRCSMRSCREAAGRCRVASRRRCRPTSTPTPRRSMRMVPLGGPQRSSQRTRSAHGGGPGAGRAPRVDDKRTGPATGERKRFASAILPAWHVQVAPVRVLPLLYPARPVQLGFRPALTQFLGLSHGLRRRRSRVDQDCRTRRRRSTSGRWPGPTTSTAGSTGSTSRSGWSRTRVPAGDDRVRAAPWGVCRDTRRQSGPWRLGLSKGCSTSLYGLPMIDTSVFATSFLVSL